MVYESKEYSEANPSGTVIGRLCQLSGYHGQVTWVPGLSSLVRLVGGVLGKVLLCRPSNLPGTHYVDKVGHELTEICLALPPNVGVKGVCSAKYAFYHHLINEKTRAHNGKIGMYSILDPVSR